MQTAQLSPELADAADVLSDQLRVHLQRLAVLIEPHSGQIEKKFLNRLRSLSFEPRQRSALAAITSGAAARILAKGDPPLKFIEQVEYNGRRLAKLNLPPSAILEALQEYDRLLAPILEGLIPDEHSNFQWVREQLHFCVVLTLNNAWLTFEEQLKGSIESGKLADFVVLSDDLLAVPDERLREITPVATFVGGRAVFTASPF